MFQLLALAVGHAQLTEPLKRHFVKMLHHDQGHDQGHDHDLDHDKQHPFFQKCLI